LSTEPRPIKVVDTAPSNNMRADKIVIKTAKTGKVNKKIKYLINYPNLHVVQLKQTRVFLIAVSYHSKSATGWPGRALLAPVPIGLRSLRVLFLAKSQQQAKGVASDTSCVESDALVWFTEVLVGFKGG
jgi:hypothetical protein